MKHWLDHIVNFVDTNETMIGWLMAFSLAVFLVSLLLVPWMILRIPADYFSQPASHRSALFENRPLLLVIMKVLRNIFGFVLVVIGLLLLVLPGQGVLCISLGLLISDFPGKHKLVSWLVFRKSVISSINWIRRRAGREPIKSKVNSANKS